jgi:hypothetical protein
MNRLAILLVAVLVGVPLTLSGGGCGSGPYSNPPERLKKPRAKKRPEGAPTASEVTAAEAAAMSDEQCRTNFFADPHRGRRFARDAHVMSNRADSTLVAAERQFGPGRQALVIEAMATLSNALKKDPYGPEPTYKLAVAYALVGKKSCSLALLERLKSLTTMPEVEKEARRTIQRATRDPAFGPFEKDARTALGE